MKPNSKAISTRWCSFTHLFKTKIRFVKYNRRTTPHFLHWHLTTYNRTEAARCLRHIIISQLNVGRSTWSPTTYTRYNVYCMYVVPIRSVWHTVSLVIAVCSRLKALQELMEDSQKESLSIKDGKIKTLELHLEETKNLNATLHRQLDTMQKEYLLFLERWKYLLCIAVYCDSYCIISERGSCSAKEAKRIGIAFKEMCWESLVYL